MSETARSSETHPEWDAFLRSLFPEPGLFQVMKHLTQLTLRECHGGLDIEAEVAGGAQRLADIQEDPALEGRDRGLAQAVEPRRGGEIAIGPAEGSHDQHADHGAAVAGWKGFDHWLSSVQPDPAIRDFIFRWQAYAVNASATSPSL